MKYNMRFIITFSVWMGANKIDWLRTIYFSLFGSSALTYAMKFKTLEICPSILFLLGVFFFLFGLIFSMIISDSFKAYAVVYPTLGEKESVLYKNIDEYIFNMENRILKYFQHLLIYLLFPLAIIVIGISSCQTEKIASDKIQSEKMKSEQNENIKAKSLEMINQQILELKISNLRLVDSLKKISMKSCGDCHVQGNDKNTKNKKRVSANSTNTGSRVSVLR